MDWLKEIRVCARKTQEDVAKAAHITQPSYANIESGRRSPAVPTAKRIAAALEFDWQRFYEEPADKKENPA